MTCLTKFSIFSFSEGPFEELFYLIGSVVGNKQEDLFYDLEIALRRHRPDFTALLVNPVGLQFHHKFYNLYQF